MARLDVVVSLASSAAANRRLYVLAAFLSFAGLAGGQVNPGTPSFSAYDSHQYDTINLQNLNVSLNVPVMSKNGAFPFNFAMTGAGSYVYIYGGTVYPGVLENPLTDSVNGTLGESTSFASWGTTRAVTCPSAFGSGAATEYLNWYIKFADGTSHSLPTTDVSYAGTSCSGGFTDQVIDGTGYTLSVTGTAVNSIYTKDGMNLALTSITDSNGNKITWNGSLWTDTLGLTALTEASSGKSWNWTDVNGGSPTASLTVTSYTFKTAYGCTGIPDSTSTGYALPTAVNFPDSTALGLAWEPTPGYASDRTGRLSQLTLRTGGTVTYNYNPSSAAHDGLNCTYQVPNSMTRTTSDGTTTYTWAASYNSGWGNTTTVVDQGGNKTVYTFTGLTATGNAAPPVTQALTQVQHYQGSSTLLTTDVYCYNAKTGQPGNCVAAVVSLPITEVDVYHTINGLANSSRQQTQYDGGPSGMLPHYGNITYSARYDFGATTPTQTTTIVYGSSNGSGACAAIGNNVNNKPCTIVTTQGGATVGYSQFTYDIHGNLLRTYVSSNGGTSFLSNATNNSYNSNGTPSVTYDLANNSTTYAYNSASYTSCSGCTSFPFPTSISKGGLTTYSTWHGIGGVKLTDKDASGNTTTCGYTDPWNRVTSIQDPLSNTVSKTYSVTSLASSFAFGSSVNNTTTTTDGYGRPIRTQTQQGPGSSNYDTVIEAYSWQDPHLGFNSRIIETSSIPCTATLGNDGNCNTATEAFVDALGRTVEHDGNNGYVTYTYTQNDVLSVFGPAPTGENTKQVQKQFDGLGRLTFSCKISSTVGGNALCNQNTNTTAKGIVTTTSYTSATGSQTASSTRGSQTRSQTVDGLSRVTQKVTPEGGTWNYYYDSSYSSCPSGYTGAAGQLEAVLDPDGNKLCYKYDSLSRVTGVNANGTACRHFYYDNSTGYSGSIPSGVSTPTNPYGRMVEAVTDSCSSGTLITDEWFSYDKDGHMTDMWEKTPHSGTYYHSVATFAGNGVPLTVHLANPNLYTMTYGLDGEGRPSTLTGNSTTVVSGTTFNAAGQPTYIDLGTGTDQSDYVYDPNTGRMTHWTFQVGSTGSETGTLTWSPNGTLRQLAIVDGFSSGGTQTCTFGTSTVMGYDDLGRLLSDNCGSVWAQTFSYDQYDNITKSGSISWNPGYSPLNNHYSSGANYDNSGNLTYDTIHLYTWDPFGKVSTIDSSTCGTNGECVTYDAMGRIVETSYNSAYTEIWYTQLGKVYMTGGTTPYYAYWPTPGNGTVEVNGNAVTLFYMHKDWLGNSRISSTITNHTVVSDQAYAPYGEVYNKLATGAGVPGQMFTGDTQDIIGGIFDTPNRELNASQGRWLSPDPAGARWNQYAYTTNPNSAVDPSGLVDINPGWFGVSGNNTAGGMYAVAGAAGWSMFGAYSTTIAVPADAGSSGLFANYNPSIWVPSGASLSSTFDLPIALENTVLTVAGWFNAFLSDPNVQDISIALSMTPPGAVAGALESGIDTISLIGSGLNLGADLTVSNSMVMAADLESSALPSVSGGSQAADAVANLLMPGGNPVGQAGSDALIREVQGGVSDAQAMFDQLAQGGTPASSSYPGPNFNLPGGGWVGLRTVMTRSPGTAATIDVTIPNIPIDKIKFNP